MNKNIHKHFVSAVIVSAGNSTRMGGINKQFLLLGNMPVIAHSIKAFEDNDLIDEIIIVTREEDIVNIKKLVDLYGFSKVKSITQGGTTRQLSVVNGISKCSDKSDYVAIHDGARPLVSQKVITDTVSDAFAHNCSATGVRVKDTVKVVDDNSNIVDTPDREYMRFVQTPQVFNLKMYKDALVNVPNSQNFTDDCMLMENFGEKVYLSLGDYENIKITTPEDIKLAENYLERR